MKKIAFWLPQKSTNAHEKTKFLMTGVVKSDKSSILLPTLRITHNIKKRNFEKTGSKNKKNAHFYYPVRQKQHFTGSKTTKKSILATRFSQNHIEKGNGNFKRRLCAHKSQFRSRKKAKNATSAMRKCEKASPEGGFTEKDEKLPAIYKSRYTRHIRWKP